MLPDSVNEIEIARICVWAISLPEITQDHEALEADIDELIARGQRNFAAQGVQTLAMLHELKSPHWERFFSGVRTVIAEIVENSAAVFDEGRVHLRAWAHRIGDEARDQKPLRLDILHNHSPAFLSAVYYLKVPPALSSGEAGTFFVNPLPHSLASPHPGVAIPAAEGRLVVFPSWIVHGPLMLGAPSSDARTIIAIDAHLVPK